MSAPRVLIVSNRLPVGIATDAGTGALTPSTGTLATALRELHQRSGGLWIGWPGNSEPLAPADRQSVTRQLADLRAVPIWLQPDEVARVNEGFAHQVLWPLFHYRVDRLPLAVDDWASYEQVNQRFAIHPRNRRDARYVMSIATSSIIYQVIQMNRDWLLGRIPCQPELKARACGSAAW